MLYSVGVFPNSLMVLLHLIYSVGLDPERLIKLYSYYIYIIIVWYKRIRYKTLLLSSFKAFIYISFWFLNRCFQIIFHVKHLKRLYILFTNLYGHEHLESKESETADGSQLAGYPASLGFIVNELLLFFVFESHFKVSSFLPCFKKR